MSVRDDEILEQLERHLGAPSLAWLVGAGASRSACIPLMLPLTARVQELSMGSPYEGLVEDLLTKLPSGSQIEHLLSHLGDYTALASRSAGHSVTVGTNEYDTEQLQAAHTGIVRNIAETIRWGYEPANGSMPERIGTRENCIVDVSGHRAFVEALFRRQSGLQERRRPIHIFTTNYDTLIEDALAFSGIQYWDGFAGGAVAFRYHTFGQEPALDGCRACVVKLHGSIDWHQSDDGRVLRVRDGDMYPGASQKRSLIYPQSTKYVATQRDPFAAQFDIFRRTFERIQDDTLVVCGYSFGDEHINQEIEMVMGRGGGRQSTLIALVSETLGLADTLDLWRKSSWGERVYVLTQNGVYVGKDGPFCTGVHDWWTFAGATRMLRDGVSAL